MPAGFSILIDNYLMMYVLFDSFDALVKSQENCHCERSEAISAFVSA
jgi:hypothetical protein